MSTAIAQIRDLVVTASGMVHVYAASEDGENGIPNALNQFPCALVYPGPDLEYILSSGQHRHTYDVIVDVIEAGDVGARAAALLPYVDRIIEIIALNVTLGGRVNSCIYKSQSGFTGVEYADGDYLGYRVILEVSEQGAATPAVGS